MKKRVAMVLLVVLVVLPGCAAQNESNATIEQQEEQIESLQGQVDELLGQVSDLESALEAEKARADELVEQQEEEKESKTAKLEIGFLPNPVGCKDGACCWEMIIKETNGIGIGIEQMIFVHRDEVGSNMEGFSKSNVEKALRLENAYLPAYGQTGSTFGFSSKSTVDHIVVVIKGKDDNGNSLEIISENLYFEGNRECSWVVENC